MSQATDVDLTIATTAAGVLAEGAAVHLVHVATAEAPVARETEGPEFGVEWTARFSALKRAIGDSAITEVNGIVLRGGEPAARLLAYAEGVNADLVVAGNREPVTIGDRLSGGIGSRILRASDRFVLLS